MEHHLLVQETMVLNLCIRDAEMLTCSSKFLRAERKNKGRCNRDQSLFNHIMSHAHLTLMLPVPNLANTK